MLNVPHGDEKRYLSSVMARSRKHSLTQKTALALKKEIQKGVWGECLPGYRKLCEQFSVSPKTMKASLDILTAEGVLLPPQSRCKRKITPQFLPHTEISSTFSVGLISPMPLQETTHFFRVVFEKLEQLLHSQGRELKYYVAKTLYLSNPDPMLDDLVAHSDCSHWLFFGASFPVVSWIHRKLEMPFLILSGDIGKYSSCPRISLSYQNYVTLGIEKFADLGHQKIVLPFFILQSDKAEELIIQYAAREFGKRNLPFLSSYNTPRIYSKDPSSPTTQCKEQKLDLLFSLSPPTAMLCVRPQDFLFVQSYCGNRGIRVPQDLSIICGADDPLLESLVPLPARIKASPSVFAQRIRKWIENPGQLRGPSHLPLSFIPGESLAPPRSTL